MLARKHSMAIVAALAAVGGAAAGFAVAAQPHMARALTDLRSADRELQAAVANKAGHRERAIELVRQAIVEVEAGVAAGQ